MKKISYYDNNKLIEEINPSWDTLTFLYQSTVGMLLRKLLYRRWLAILLGKYYDSSLSRRDIKTFIQKYQIDMNDYVQPTGGYTSFNDFFVRTLKPEARKIDHNPHIITSPADSKVYVVPNISQDTLFFIKHKPFDLARFLASKQLAQEYTNGTLFIFRLAPYDYHRFHFPVDSIPSKPKIINGILESVNPITFKTGIQPLTENERHLILLKTEHFDTIAMLPVGAMMVGKIIETFIPNQSIKKGDESGYFAFGGSTVVLLFKAGAITPRAEFVQHSLQGVETAVKMGEAINQ